MSIDLVTWNLNGLSEQALNLRFEVALHETLLGARIEELLRGKKPIQPPSLILLQEVTEAGFFALKPHLKAGSFDYFPRQPPDRGYFELVAVRAPCSIVEAHSELLPETLYGRWLHQLEVATPLGSKTIFTAHFDSGPEKRVSEIREVQTRAVLERLNQDAVFGGDTNLRDHEWMAAAEGAPLVQDAWEAAGADERHRFTWHGAGRRARFDRVWTSTNLTVLGFETFGGAYVSGLGQPPSDHLGLRVKFK